MKLVLVLCFLALQGIAFTQSVKFGKVSKDELKETQYALDKDAEAAILFQYRRTYLNNEIDGYIEENYVKIKIYNKDKATDWLNFTINLSQVNSKTEKVYDFKGVTYNLNNGKIEETKIDKKTIHKEEASEYRNTFSFQFPNVQNGSILEFKYDRISPFLGQIDDVYFQYEIPLKSAEFILEYPEFLKYEKHQSGVIRPTSSKNENRIWNDSHQLIVEKITYENVPARKKEDFVMNDDNLKPYIGYELGGVEIPGQMYKDFSLSWDGVFKSYRESQKFGTQLKQENFFKEYVADFISDDPNKTAFQILNFVQNHMTWNGYYSEYAKNGVKKAFKEKTGNSADINLMLVNMLNAAGVKAYPVLLSTPGSGYINPSRPTSTKFNYVIAAYEYNGNINFLDATTPFSSINGLPKRALGLTGYLIDGSKYHTVEIINAQNSKNYEAISATFSEGEISGDYRDNFNKFYAIQESERFYSDKNSYKSNLQEKLHSNLDDMNISFENSKFTIESPFSYSEVDKAGKQIFFNPLLFTAAEEQIFNSSNRTQNIEFGSPFTHVKRVKVKVPDSYTIKSIPETKAYKLPNDVGVYQYSITQNGNDVLVNSQFVINQSILPATYYESLKTLYSKIIEAETQLVALEKK